MTVEEMFDAYAKNFSFFAPEYHGIFVCPLCSRGFDRSALKAGLLSEEHIVPEAVGGKLTTLTCRQCNNTDGSRVESHLCIGLTIEDVFEGLRSHRGTITAGGFDLHADIRMPNRLDAKPTLVAVGRDGKSHPKHVEGISSILAAPKPEGTITFRFRCEKHKYSAAFLRMAYLMMFHYYGYSYFVLRCARAIREAIANPPVKSPFYWAIQEIPAKPALSNCVGVVHDPPELRSFLVLVTVRTEKERYFAVQLPGLLAPDPFSIYESMKRLGSGQLDYTVFESNPYYYDHPEMTGSLVRLWKQCISS